MNRPTLSLLLAWMLAPSLRAAPGETQFPVPSFWRVNVALVLPPSADIQSHGKAEGREWIRARIPDAGRAGMLIQISDFKGQALWKHDFGYNLSATEGCEVEVSWLPGGQSLLLHYHGYKWDHAHKLLFVVADGGTPAVHEYSGASQDILPYLKLQKNFPGDHEYWIYPLRLAAGGVEFECIPINKSAGHPFAQDQPWWRVSATVDRDCRVVPWRVDSTR